MKCYYQGCKTEFGVSRHKYKCGICGKYFCDDHACNTSYFRHLKGLHFYEIDKVINGKGYLCRNCFKEYGPENPRLEANIFNRVCHIEGCEADLKSPLTIKYACVSCGMLACKAHSLEIDDTKAAWQQRYMKYPLGERICSQCFKEKEADPVPRVHENALNLRLAAGDPDGTKRAIIVHGILSRPGNLEWFSRNLVRNSILDSVWVYDDLAYRGRVNAGGRIGPGDIPLGIDIKTISKSILKILGKKAYQIVDLPSYIVEGVARNIASTLKLLGWRDVTLIGHSLGGLVVRCAAETYQLNEQVPSIITMGSPFQVWQKTHFPDYWKCKPDPKINYLTILGKDDWVTTSRAFGDLTRNDKELRNVCKVIIPGLDHTTIHEKASAAYLFDFLSGFLSGEIHNGKDAFYVRRIKGNLKAYISGLHGKPSVSDHHFGFPGEWIEFEKI